MDPQCLRDVARENFLRGKHRWNVPWKSDPLRSPPMDWASHEPGRGEATGGQLFETTGAVCTTRSGWLRRHADARAGRTGLPTRRGGAEWIRYLGGPS